MEEDEQVAPVSLIDFEDIWQDSVIMGDSRHLSDWLVYNGHIIPQQEED